MKRNRKPHKNLEVWKLSIHFVKDIYTLTTNFSDEEKLGIISQLRRAVVSITTNIAEDAARSTKRNLVTFYDSLLTAHRSLLTMFTAYRSLLTTLYYSLSLNLSLNLYGRKPLGCYRHKNFGT